jgi:hypothetical protein
MVGPPGNLMVVGMAEVQRPTGLGLRLQQELKKLPCWLKKQNKKLKKLTTW